MLPFSLRSSLMRVGTGDSWPLFADKARLLLNAEDVLEGVNVVDEDEEPEAETVGNDKKKFPKDYLLLIDTVITQFYNGNRDISEVWSPGSTAVGGAPRVEGESRRSTVAIAERSADCACACLYDRRAYNRVSKCFDTVMCTR